MGIKDVFDRIKGKSDPKSDPPSRSAPPRRQTDEETVQASVGSAPAPAPSREDEQATRVAPPPKLDRPMPKARSDTPTNPGIAAANAPPNHAPANDTNEPTKVITDDATDPTIVASPGPAPQPAAPAPRAAPSAAAPATPGSTTPVPPKPGSPAAAAAAAGGKPVSSADATVYATPEADPEDAIVGVLVSLFGETRGKSFLIREGEQMLGRGDDCSVQILDAKISRRHATLSSEADGLTLRPQSDRNPTLVNDAPITDAVVLADGDKLQFGNAGASIFRFRTIDGL